MRANSYSPILISKVRSLPILRLLPFLAEKHLFYSRRDESYSPVKNGASVRLHVSSPGGQAWDIILTNEKWFDVRSGTGGGGSIDLVMFLLGNATFKKAMSVIVSALPERF